MAYQLLHFVRGCKDRLDVFYVGMVPRLARGKGETGLYLDTPAYHGREYWLISGWSSSVAPGEECETTKSLKDFLAPLPPGDYRVPYSVGVSCSRENARKLSVIAKAGAWFRSFPFLNRCWNGFGADSERFVVESEGELVFSVRAAGTECGDPSRQK